MNKSLMAALTDAERLLVDETSKEAMAGLDEDQLLDLHARIRRARTKHVTNYRRRASAGVRGRGGRGASFPENQRARAKAEAFETALAQVSRQLGVLAGRAAAELKAERLAAARPTGAATAAKPPAAGKRAAAKKPATKARATKTTGGLKKDAASRSQGARRQAKRDAR